MNLVKTLSSRCVLNVQCDCKITNNDEFVCKDEKKTLAYLEVFLSNRAIFYTSFVINNKNLPNLTDFVFTGFSINNLDLSLNEIEFISEFTFTGMTLLKELRFSSNKLKTTADLIRSITYSKLKTLTDLEMEKNLIDSLSCNFTDSFVNLLVVSFEENKIGTINQGVFQNLGNLTRLVFKL
jgi:hypothetical protein